MMKYMILLVLVVLPHDAWAQNACTQIGCTNGLTIKVEKGLLDKPGDYDINMAIDGVKVTCKGEMPLKSCDQGRSFTCTSKAVVVGESGCALPKDAHTIPDITIRGTPRKVTMAINYKNEPFLIRTLRPVYHFTRPNGPNCEPQCITSSVSLSLKKD